MASVPLEDLIEDFINKGGKINKYYLTSTARRKHALVYMKGWYGGRNLRIAINKALADQA